MFIRHMPGASAGWRKGADSLELQIVVRFYVGAKNQTQNFNNPVTLGNPKKYTYGSVNFIS